MDDVANLMDRLRASVAYRQFQQSVERPNPARPLVSDRQAPDPEADRVLVRAENVRSWQGPPDPADGHEVFVIQPREQNTAPEPPILGSLMQRYRPPAASGEAPRAQVEAPSPRALSEIFARLEAQAR